MPVVLIVLVGVVVIPIAMYNRLVRLRNQCRESWSGIDTELKRRYDLIPNLVEVVKGYAKHEQQTLLAVTEARARAVSSTGSPGAQAVDENAFVDQVRCLLAVSEKYPDLKANDQYLRLTAELVNTEDRIQAARRFYNANVRDYNTRIEVFPSSLIAGAFGFRPEEFFEVEDSGIRVAPAVRV